MRVSLRENHRFLMPSLEVWSCNMLGLYTHWFYAENKLKDALSEQASVEWTDE